MTEREAPSTDLTDISTRRAEIGDAVAELERALAAPAGVGEAWTGRVVDALRLLGELGQEQSRAVTAPGGLVDELRSQRPAFVQRAEALNESLDEVLAELHELVEAVPKVEPRDAREKVLPFLGRVVRLRQTMADLIWDAYWVDVGGPE
ncbi:MAG: hypothetical protein OEV40_03065 [Acidimicrobiia bacterium]|nr:hypothetical protein [Acidimicrobiia bacterium]